MTTEKQLDTILELLLKNWIDLKFSDDTALLMEKLKVNKEELYPLIMKLYDDKYTYKQTENSPFEITVNGKLFIKRGGYAGKKFKDQVKHIANIANIVVICIAAIAGIILAVYQIQEIIQSKQVPTEKIWQCPKE